MSRRRRGMMWYTNLTDQSRVLLNSQVTLNICNHMLDGRSLGLSKALTRDELDIGYILVDHIARMSYEVLNLQQQLKKGCANEKSKTS